MYDSKPTTYQSEYKPYESSYTKTDNYIDSYSSSYKPNNEYKPVEYIPSTVYKPEITGKTDYFKPVEPTHLTKFDSYKSTYVEPQRYTTY